VTEREMLMGFTYKKPSVTGTGIGGRILRWEVFGFTYLHWSLEEEVLCIY
jgi:hypothetical protein